MTTSVHIYAIPESYLLEFAGKSQPGLFEALVEGREVLLEDIDEDTRERVDDGDTDSFLSCADALRNIISGAPMHAEHSTVYALTYEFVCQVLAYESFNDWASVSGLSDFLDRVNAVANTTRGDLALLQLIFGGSPFGIPYDDDGISFGWWTNKQVRKNRKKLTKLSRKGRDYLNTVDPDGSQYVAEMLVWLDCAMANKEGAIVAISY